MKEYQLEDNTPSQRPKRSRPYTLLAGPKVRLTARKKYRVAYKDIVTNDLTLYRIWAKVISYGTLALIVAYACVILWPSHWLITQYPDAPYASASIVMLMCLILLVVFLIVGTYSATRATVHAKNPVPVSTPKNLRVAFATTRAPGEPIEMVEATLRAAKQVRYGHGMVDVWLLDETKDERLKTICKDLSVHYFSRKGVKRWNTPPPEHILNRRRLHAIFLYLLVGIRSEHLHRHHPDPYYAAKTKHGNFNAWRQYLSNKGISYDILAGVDTDQVPESNYLNRMLGYFRDPDVGFVVGPQVYGNYKFGYDHLVVRWAESQASFFQSTIQRAGNASESPMFVGTNYAVRVKTLDQINGFQPCITEDMATGLAIHAHKNPATGNRWRSVYTPDVLAIGEGPNFWAPYFAQQWRWAAGTFDTWRRMVWRVAFRLPFRVGLNYFLMLTYYPIAALTWILGVASSMIYLLSGASAILVPWNQFLSLYLMILVMQMSLYFWNRRFNVSPHEPVGSYGVSGMIVSTITAPIYVSAMVCMLIGKKVSFVVTTKGAEEADNPDGFSTFRMHLQWGALLAGALIFGILHNHTNPAMLVWVVTLLIVCLLPVCIGLPLALKQRVRSTSRTGKAGQHA